MRPSLFLRNHSRLLVLILIFVSTVGAYMVSQIVLKGEKLERFARFDGAASNSALAFGRAIEKTETVVRSIVSFYDSSDQVTRSDFRHFVTDAIERNPGIQALAWLPKVSHRERAEFVAKIRAQGDPDFDVMERGEGGRMVKAGVRPFYYPMTYAEPLKANLGSLGFDVGSDASRLAIIDKAASSNQWISTPRAMLTHGIVQEAAVFLFAPIYGMRASEVKKLQYPEMTLHGVTLVVLNIDRLMASAFQDMKFEKNFALYLYDVSGEAETAPLSSWGSADTVQTAISLGALTGQKISARFKIGEREWALVAVDTDLSSGAGLSLLVFYLLVAASVVMAVALGIQLSRHEMIKRQVEERTAELERQRTQLEQIVTDRTMIIEEQALELQQALQQEKLLNESQRNFIAATSHEFRTPLAIIDKTAQKLSHSTGRLVEADVQARAEKISGAVTHMVTLMNSALAAANIESGDYRFNPTYCDITAIVTGCCARQQEQAPSHVIRFEQPPMGEEIYVDPVAMERIVARLLYNAVKHSPGGSDVVVELRACGADICISVTDAGDGIDKADQPLFAEGFFRPHRAADEDGTSLTLSQCRFLVELHGGKLKIRSQKGEGSRFTIRVPKHAPSGKTKEVA